VIFKGVSDVFKSRVESHQLREEIAAYGIWDDDGRVDFLAPVKRNLCRAMCLLEGEVEK
jgi:hypothetical protein|tara:strand:- start:1090 stop:1266 length:177 start_codon:yes stop_codon:yes gene_type:complete